MVLFVYIYFSSKLMCHLYVLLLPGCDALISVIVFLATDTIHMQPICHTINKHNYSVFLCNKFELNAVSGSLCF